MSLNIKLCGFKRKEDIDFACQFDIDFMGFVFYEKSPRNVDLGQIQEITKNIPNKIKKVAVTVNVTDLELEEIIQKLKPQLIQLHGEESAKRVQEIKEKFQLPIIKAFRISQKSDLDQIRDFENIADYFLFDAKIAGLKGGSGEVFDWNILKDFKINKKWFLSGGIDEKNLEDALNLTKAPIIDLSSAIEEEKGQKSSKLIENFMKIANKLKENN